MGALYRVRENHKPRDIGRKKELDQYNTIWRLFVESEQDEKHGILRKPA